MPAVGFKAALSIPLRRSQIQFVWRFRYEQGVNQLDTAAQVIGCIASLVKSPMVIIGVLVLAGLFLSK